MDKAVRLRWSALMAALAATVLASVYPVDEPEEGDAVVEAERLRPQAASAMAERDFAKPAFTDEETVDPFAPRGWQAAPEPIAVATSPAPAPVIMGPPAPPSPPPLPYRFMGRLNDDGVEVVYLSKGDQSLIARNGETLDGMYKIVAMDAQRIEFEHLPSGDKQTLQIPALEK